MNKLLLVLGAALLVVGCGSSVKLDETPVTDRSTDSTATTSQGAGQGTGQSTVKPVDMTNKGSQIAMPAGSRTVYFDYDSYVIKAEYQNLLVNYAAYIKADKSRKVALEGHTDERGGREYNLALGQKRSEAVKKALVLLGVADAQLEAVSFGKEKPAASGNNEVTWSKNRRAELSFR